MSLSDVELRVLGCLVEKQMTTPASYPMTLNALVAACNQRSNRSPVVDYDAAGVDDGIERLRESGLARTVHGKGDRALKYRHVAGEVLHLDDREVALLAVLMLRAPQTPGELRARSERYLRFGGIGEVEDTLLGMNRRDGPLVERMERRPGEKEARFRHLLGVDEERSAGEAPAELASEPRGGRAFSRPPLGSGGAGEAPAELASEPRGVAAG